MAEDDDKDNKTEEPTFKRLEEAREKGQIPNSKEVSHFFILFALAFIIIALLPPLARQMMVFLTPFIARTEDFAPDDMSALTHLFARACEKVALMLLIPMMLAIVAALAAGGLQTRFNISTESIVPKLSKISPLKGLGRLFSLRSVVDLGKGILKISIVGTVATLAVWPSMPHARLLPDQELTDIMIFTAALAKRMLIGVLCAMFVIAILDYLYQRHELLKSLRMTKQEIRDEYKQQEGDPHIKQKLKQIRSERARKRMMAQVPNSDVVITNPTHFAVALKYDPATMAAPKVLAKGQDKVAFRIRDLAEKNRIPVLRNPPLARALFANAEVDEEIPLEYYAAVAQVIGYIYKLKGKAPKSLKVPDNLRRR